MVIPITSPFEFAKGDGVRSSDTLTDKRFLEMKDIMPDSSNRMVMNDITSAKGQAEDIYINITNSNIICNRFNVNKNKIGGEYEIK